MPEKNSTLINLFYCQTFSCSMSHEQCDFQRQKTDGRGLPHRDAERCADCDWKKMRKNPPYTPQQGYKKIPCSKCGGRVACRTEGDVCSTCKMAEKDKVRNPKGYRVGVRCAECGGKIANRTPIEGNGNGELCSTCRAAKSSAKISAHKVPHGYKKDTLCTSCGGFVGCRTEGDVCSACREESRLATKAIIQKGLFPVGELSHGQVLSIMRKANTTFTNAENKMKAIEEAQEVALALLRLHSPAANQGKHDVSSEFLQEAANFLITLAKTVEEQGKWKEFSACMEAEVLRLEQRVENRLSA